jgi:enterochelin esterase-like enzyme
MNLHRALLVIVGVLACSVGWGFGQAAKGGKAWVPVGAKQLAKALRDPQQASDAKALASMVYRCFGKQGLSQGKAGAKVEETTVAWAVLSEAPARVLDGRGMVLGEMQRVGDEGLQVLAREMLNYADHEYKIEAEGKTLLAGTARVEHYPLPPEASPGADVPRGKAEVFTFAESKVFPGTTREVTVYVPAQYKPDGSAALMVWQDGSRHADPKGGMRATLVADSLIARGEMPVTVGVFIDPGRKASQKPGDKAANRGFEYDSLGDAYSRFLIDEVLPEVQKRYGLKWSDDAAKHAICGGSSGGICAFTAAWERPEVFGKVLSWVGSFVDLRGGHVYPAMIRQTERKPIRVYLLDGRNDLDNAYGNWPLANQNMAASLKYRGYDYRFDYGECFHGSKGMSASLPEALRWLWR